jgi:hypothetical protein
VDSIRKVTLGIGYHRPFQGGDFLGSQTRLQGQEKDDPLAWQMVACGEVSVNRFGLNPRRTYHVYHAIPRKEHMFSFTLERGKTCVSPNQQVSAKKKFLKTDSQKT